MLRRAADDVALGLVYDPKTSCDFRSSTILKDFNQHSVNVAVDLDGPNAACKCSTVGLVQGAHLGLCVHAHAFSCTLNTT